MLGSLVLGIWVLVGFLVIRGLFIFIFEFSIAMGWRGLRGVLIEVIRLFDGSNRELWKGILKFGNLERGIWKRELRSD